MIVWRRSSFTFSADRKCLVWRLVKMNDLKERFSRSRWLERIPSKQRLYKRTLSSCRSLENSQSMLLKRGDTSLTANLQGAAAGGGINICAAQTAVWQKMEQNVPSAELHFWTHPVISNPTGRAAEVYPPPSILESALNFDRWNELQKPQPSFAGDSLRKSTDYSEDHRKQWIIA